MSADKGRGQGLNNAILDVASLGRQLVALPSKSLELLPQAIAEYQKELWERGREAVESSNLNSLFIHNWEQVQSSPLFKAGLRQHA
jgi:2-polyprenyl-6-methoxyphenol hydroxylase-like FAD-dependent oxidoreductase